MGAKMVMRMGEFDVAVIGAGISGLAASSLLGKSILIEKLHRAGGTSYSFKREGCMFLTGPLGFSYPELVRSLLSRFSVYTRFRRKSYRIKAGEIDFRIDSLDVVERELKRLFPHQDVERAIEDIRRAIGLLSNRFFWRGRFFEIDFDRIGNGVLNSLRPANFEPDLEKTPSAKEFFSEYIDNEILLNILSALGPKDSEQSLASCILMWNIIDKGIWYPEIGFKGIIDGMAADLKAKIVKNTAVRSIESGDKFRIETSRGVYFADKLISCMDPLKLSEILDVRVKSLEDLKPGGSTLTVYCLTDMKADSDHILYYPSLDESNNLSENRFYDKEIEITFLHNLSDEFCPGSVMIRAAMDYDEFKFESKEEYNEFKKQVSEELVEVVKAVNIDKIKIVDSSTPITYEVWGGRYRGSVAGWDWSDAYPRCLVETDIPGLYVAGLYSFSIPLFGGFPTSLLSGFMAAELALNG
ncbi:Phytoene dehydrogenase-related protein [Archaeoglobus sulfaticallidus PM70-1]|uniref:Phytoene dehydrogenase-related protein n=1 Tax=Archaeoglobus sulfaticallidus PM70-1 TaxID=387631 RepID=N0BIY8_9EURY|nr:NAD(P)/FAD-dependent oxidoreductase [Archaeoglobus sulfaticallidus]AGK60115.1 Phytoene dehydrogenase-related protein [Archaeoglobus sulfaticallidus PM70-1]